MKRQIHLKPEDLKESDKLGLTYNLGQAHKMMLLRQSGIMKKFGLTARQSLIIAYLSTHKKEVVTQKTLEDHLHLTNPTITVMVKSMIEKGMIRKEVPAVHDRKGKTGGTGQPESIQGSGRIFLRRHSGKRYAGVQRCAQPHYEKPGYGLIHKK